MVLCCSPHGHWVGILTSYQFQELCSFFFYDTALLTFNIVTSWYLFFVVAFLKPFFKVCSTLLSMLINIKMPTVVSVKPGMVAQLIFSRSFSDIFGKFLYDEMRKNCDFWKKYNFGQK